ncbi:hypothetical protein IWW38_004752 [Coemansia aciculifera]|uniref:Uncharacterized protein n=1 Tax=Coemansia aciculifera TaxID=417176 RepID=A0ACC1LYI0_9FUNG|nr:hypothetical protein IWW38_004752 [Coemansia aciculifera]
MPASANNSAVGIEVRAPQELFGDLGQRRRSCPDLYSSFTDITQEPAPPPYDPQTSENTVHPGDLASTISEFVRFDDMDIENGRVRQFSTAAGKRQCLDEISKDGYLLFYVLEQIDGRSVIAPK